MTSKVYLNGRFLGQRTTGIQRYALETLSALDTILFESADRNVSFELLAPHGTPMPSLRAIRTRCVGPLQGHLWEQLTLPWAARDGLLWSFGPTGPLLTTQQSVTIHDATLCAIPGAFSWKFRALYGLAMPWLAQRVTQVMTVSEFSRDEIARHYGAATSALRVSGEGWQHTRRIEPDLAVLKQHDLVPQRYVLAVSSVIPHKNFAVIARALARLQGADYRVVIAGELNEKIYGTIAALSLKSATLLGYVSDAELRALYENAGVFVFPSLYEGFGLPPLEAMSLGCPVIASRAASMPEVCGDGAVYFEPHDDGELARLIQRLMSSEDERRAWADKGLAQLSRHSWESSARRHLSAIGEALARSSKGAVVAPRRENQTAP